MYNKGDSVLAKQYIEQADLLFKDGKYAEALELNKKVLEIYNQILVEPDMSIATAYLSTSKALWKNGKYDEGIEYAEKAKAISNKENSEKSIEILSDALFVIGQY